MKLFIRGRKKCPQFSQWHFFGCFVPGHFSATTFIYEKEPLGRNLSNWSASSLLESPFLPSLRPYIRDKGLLAWCSMSRVLACFDRVIALLFVSSKLFEDYSSVPTISDDYYISDCIWNKKKDMRHISSMIAKKQILYINFMGTDIYIYIDHYHIFLNSLMTMIFSTLTDGCVSLEIYFL